MRVQSKAMVLLALLVLSVPEATAGVMTGPDCQGDHAHTVRVEEALQGRPVWLLGDQGELVVGVNPGLGDQPARIFRLAGMPVSTVEELFDSWGALDQVQHITRHRSRLGTLVTVRDSLGQSALGFYLDTSGCDGPGDELAAYSPDNVISVKALAMHTLEVRADRLFESLVGEYSDPPLLASGDDNHGASCTAGGRGSVACGVEYPGSMASGETGCASVCVAPLRSCCQARRQSCGCYLPGELAGEPGSGSGSR